MTQSIALYALLSAVCFVCLLHSIQCRNLAPLFVVDEHQPQLGRRMLQQSSGSCADQQQLLAYHNSVRGDHGASTLQWNDTLAAEAARVAGVVSSAGCSVTVDTKSSNPDIGSNVFVLQTSASSLRNTSCLTAAQRWYAERSNYQFITDNFTTILPKLSTIGHFTLMIWKSTTQVGCAQVQCSGTSYTVVCSYYPAGNVLAPSDWAANVQPPRAWSPPPTPSGGSGATPGTPAAIPTPASSDMASSKCPDPQVTLDEHNKRRALHGVPPLIWNASLVASSQTWANVLASEGCQKLHHSKYPGIGENLYSLFITSDFGQLSNVNCVNAVAPWYDEIALYNYDQVEAMWVPNTFETIGHFTAMIWRSTTALGCTNAVCGDRRGLVVVCQMWPQGNIIGNKALWERNVPRPLSSSQAPQTAG